MKYFRDRIRNIKYNGEVLLFHRSAIKYRISKENKHYNAPVNPFNLVAINPGVVYYNIRNSNYHFEQILKNLYRGKHVQNGVWDHDKQKIVDNDYYKSLFDHFINGIPWTATEIYKKTEQCIKSGVRYWHQCDNVQSLNERCEYLDGLYADISSNGYKTQWVLINENKISMILGSRIWRQPEFQEIVVGIGRGGEYIVLSGKHRLAIVQLLQLKSIPVCVLVRHSHWQSIRDRIYREGNPGDYESHPDIQSLLEMGDR